MLRLAVGALAFALSTGAIAVSHGARGQAAPAAADPGKKAFGQCAACHAVAADTHRIGPSLHKIVGRKIGSAAGYSYSPAMAKKGGKWTEAALDAYLTNPQAYVKGTKMSYPGQKDAAKRAALIGYLKTL